MCQVAEGTVDVTVVARCPPLPLEVVVAAAAAAVVVLPPLKRKDITAKPREGRGAKVWKR